MRLGYFTDKACERLMADIDTNRDKYFSDEDWIPSFFYGSDDYYKMSSVTVEQFTPYHITDNKMTNADKALEDYHNTIRLYDAFKTLTPWQAAQGNMWAYLCHTDSKCRSYIRHRWLDDPRENTIRARFFAPTNESLRNDNALSRLWWYGYLTYDQSAENPYHLTKILLTNLTIATDIIDTLNRTNPERLKGVLLAIDEFKDKLKVGESLTDLVREANLSLNWRAGVTVMDSLSSDEIRSLYLKYLQSAHEKK